MSENDNQIASALVAVGTKGLTVRSASLVKRGLALVPLLTREREVEVEIAKRIERGQAWVFKALSRSPIVVQEMFALRGQLKRGERSFMEVVVFNDDELTEDKIYEKLQKVIGIIDEMERLYKRALHLQAKRKSIPRTERPRDYRRYALAEARHRILVSQLFRCVEFTHPERRRLIARIRQAVDELKPVEREVNRLERKLEGSRAGDHKDLREELRQYRARLGEIEDHNQASVIALKRTLNTIREGELIADAAKRHLIEARSLARGYAGARVNAGNALYEKGDLDGAAAEYREALRLNPNDDTAHNNLGVALHDKGDLGGAIAEYRMAIRLEPDDADSHYNLGFALDEKGDLDGAVAEYREALRLDPTGVTAHNDLGTVLEKKGDLRGAGEEYRAAYALDVKNADYKRNYERLLEHMNPMTR
ncbi:MAG: tetratricopeptide repeat protein [Terriglobia bacterium]